MIANPAFLKSKSVFWDGLVVSLFAVFSFNCLSKDEKRMSSSRLLNLPYLGKDSCSTIGASSISFGW